MIRRSQKIPEKGREGESESRKKHPRRRDERDVIFTTKDIFLEPNVCLISVPSGWGKRGGGGDTCEGGGTGRELIDAGWDTTMAMLLQASEAGGEATAKKTVPIYHLKKKRGPGGKADSSTEEKEHREEDPTTKGGGKS